MDRRHRRHDRYAYVTFVGEGLVRLDPASGDRKVLVAGRAPGARLAGGALYVVSVDGAVSRVSRDDGSATPVATLPKDVSSFGFDGQTFVFLQSASSSSRTTPEPLGTKTEVRISYDGKLVELRASDKKTFDLLTNLAELSGKCAVHAGDAFCSITGGAVESVDLR
jgi:hypothetical protein